MKGPPSCPRVPETTSGEQVLSHFLKIDVVCEQIKIDLHTTRLFQPMKIRIFRLACPAVVSLDLESEKRFELGNRLSPSRQTDDTSAMLTKPLERSFIVQSAVSVHPYLVVPVSPGRGMYGKRKTGSRFLPCHTLFGRKDEAVWIERVGRVVWKKTRCPRDRELFVYTATLSYIVIVLAKQLVRTLGPWIFV